MELLSKDITLGFYNDTGIINLPVSQYDTGRVISIAFTNDGKRFEIPESTSVFLKAVKPDGKQINTDEWCSIQENRVVIEVSRQLSAAPGTVKCELVLGDNTGKQYTSNRFNIIVCKPVHNDENLISSDVCKDITSIYMELNAIKDHSHNTDNPHAVTKKQIGLEYADNTADTDKPVSTAQREALNLKADLESPVLTGTPEAPTAPSGTNTTQIATTAYAQKAISDHNTSLTSHNDIRNLISTLTTRVNTLTDGSNTSDLDSRFVKKDGDTMSGTLTSSKSTNSYLAGNQGHAIINSAASPGAYTMLDKLNSANGYFTDGVYQNKRLLQYTAKTTADAGTNSVTKSVTLLDESGNSSFPGTVSAASFSGNATSATKATGDKNGKQIDTTYATKAEVNDLKKSVSDGKSEVANAITGKGVTTAADAAFATMAANIGKLKTTFRTQSKSVTPNEHVQTLYPDSGFDGLYAVSVGAAPDTSPPPGNIITIPNVTMGIYRFLFLRTYGKRIKITTPQNTGNAYWKCRYYTNANVEGNIFYGIVSGNSSNEITRDSSSNAFIGSENYDFVGITYSVNGTFTNSVTIEWLNV